MAGRRRSATSSQPWGLFSLILPLFLSYYQALALDSFIHQQLVPQARPMQIPSGLHLRGSGEEEEADAAAKRMDANLELLTSHLDDLDKHLEGRKDKDIMGYSSRGMPMSFNPQNAEIVEEPEYVSEEFDPQPKHGPWAPKEDDLKAAMEMVDWMDGLVDDMQPENILKKLKEMGASPDDVEPIMNKAGTRMGSIYELDKHRDRLQSTLQDVKATHAQLRMAMKQKAPMDELMEEVKNMKEEELNPYVQLLHEWKKKSDHEHDSGAFHRQLEAMSAPKLPVEGAKEEKNKKELQGQAAKPAAVTGTSKE